MDRTTQESRTHASAEKRAARRRAGSVAAGLALVSLAASALACDGALPRAKGGKAESSTPAQRSSKAAKRERRAPPAGWIPQRPEFEELARELGESANPIGGRERIDEIEAKLARPGITELERAQLECMVALDHLRLGDVDTALELLDAKLAAVRERPRLAFLLPELHRVRALCHLRAAEVENCIERHNRSCCIFPLADGGIHTVDEAARSAKADLLEYLNATQPSTASTNAANPYVASTWLLNVMCMALDEYPDGVPKKFLVPPRAFASEYELGRFVDVAPELGLDCFDLAGGVIVDDFDGDLLFDVVASTCDFAGPMKAFRNEGDGTFADASADWRLDDQLGGLNIVGGDYDNDGALDIFVPRGGWMLEAGRVRRSLLRNEGDGSFTDVSRAAGVAEPRSPTQTAVWADFDDDGWLDLFVGNESSQGVVENGSSFPCNLFRNRADGTFEDVAAAAGVTNDRYTKGAAAGDYDGDGDMDLYCSNLDVNRLYRNDGDLTFEDVAVELGVQYPVHRSFATWFFDYDNDGELDLWASGYNATASDSVLGYMGQGDLERRTYLYRNEGNGKLTDVSRKVGLGRVWLPMGANFGDFDNDGWLDVYLGTGDPNFEAILPNVALRNDRGRRFQDVTQSSGLGHLQKGHGIGFADIDQDGDQDIYHSLGGFLPADGFRNALFLNPGHGNHSIGIELRGVQTNRQGVGARLALVLDTPSGRRELHRAPGCVSSFGGSPRRQEVGLGDATAIAKIEVFWPTSGIRQTLTGVPLDGLIRITEGVEGFEELAYEPIELDVGSE